jgi:hypothetical protein
MLRASRRRPGNGRPVRAKTIRSLLGALVLISVMVAAPAAASAEEGVVAFPGSPLSVFIGSRGECQSSYPLTGVNYFVAEKGDCGFFLAFPKKAGQPAFLKEKVFGFTGGAGPGIGGEGEYVPVSQSPVTGAGTGGSPYTETTVYDVDELEGETVKKVFAEVIDATSYVAGAPQFTSTFTVVNKSGSTVFYRALYAGDLYVAGNDFGVGSFLGGPPRFIGGLNTAEGILGGFIESTPWSAWEEGCWNDGEVEGTEGGRCAGDSAGDKGIWHTVRGSATKETGAVFNDEADPAQIDNGVGVEWDEPLTAGLANGASQSFTVVNHTEAPAGLSVAPANQTLTQGQTETVGVTALNTAGKPYAGGIVRYSVGGANPQAGSITLNAAGQGQISYVGNNVGIDTIQMYLDIPNSGSQTATDPSATAAVTFLPKPPVPNSTYTIKSIRANSNGTITITFVPTQSGQATLEVTVPTATISSAQAAKAKKCKKGQVKIHGKCRPISTVSGKVRANGIAGVPLTLSVKPSSKVKAALKKGRTVHLTAKLTYKSALGGAPVVKVFHLTVKPPKKKHH